MTERTGLLSKLDICTKSLTETTVLQRKMEQVTERMHREIRLGTKQAKIHANIKLRKSKYEVRHLFSC